MIIETERLEIIPLTIEELKSCLIDKKQVLCSKNVSSKNDELDNKMKQVYEIKISKMEKDLKNFLFYTNWLIIDRNSRIEMGSLGFKGTVDRNGEIEIGYGLFEEYFGNGYMTEAVNALISWLFENYSNFKFIKAQVSKDNIKSQNVLLRCGMVRYSEIDDFFWFKKINNKY